MLYRQQEVSERSCAAGLVGCSRREPSGWPAFRSARCRPRAATRLGAWRGRIEHRTARPLMPSVGHSRDDRSRCRSTLDVLHHVEVMQRPLAIGSLLGWSSRRLAMLASCRPKDQSFRVPPA